MTDIVRPLKELPEVPEQAGPSLVDEMRVPLADWTDPGAAGRVAAQIIRSID